MLLFPVLSLLNPLSVMPFVQQIPFAWAIATMEAVGIAPKVCPIRGGTDGARLSYEGLPCPNLFTGGENFHGRFEFIPVEDMELAVRLLTQLLTGF